MNRLFSVLIGLAAFFLTGQSRSEDTPRGNAAPGSYLERMLKVFDQDGDGKLNEEERATARRATEQFLGSLKEQGENSAGRSNLAAVLKRFDTNGDGKLSDEEKAAALKGRDGQMKKGPLGGFDPANPPEFIVKRFDKDGDGKLSDTEEAAAKAEMAKRRGGGGGAAGGLTPGEGKPQESKLEKDELIKKFDKDGDGRLNEEEKAAARAAFQKRDPK